MKNIILLALLILPLSIFGQITWNQQLPIAFQTHHNIIADAILENDRLLVAAGGHIVETDQLGAITGHLFTFTGLDNVASNFARKRLDPLTNRYVLLHGVRQSGFPGGYILQKIEAGLGVTNTLVLTDTLSSLSSHSPAVLMPDDSTIFVFGRKKAHKVRVNQDLTFTAVWQQPLTLSGSNGVSAAISLPNGNFVVFTINGDIAGLNSAGQQIFSKTQPYSFYGAVALPDGIAVCGKNADQKAVLAKLDFNGELVWVENFESNAFNAVISESDGSFLATGTSLSYKVNLVKISASGSQLWSSEYQKGAGMQLVKAGDGGYLLLAISSEGFSACVIKTDAEGMAPPLNKKIWIDNRLMKSANVEVGFEPAAPIYLNGDAWNSFTQTEPNAACVFTPWIGGLDQEGSLHVAAGTYPLGVSDFESGVYHGENGDFSRVWLAKRSEIVDFRKDFLVDNEINNPVPFDLLTWPAKGNPNGRVNLDFSPVMTAPSLFAAPFVDWNHDGIYNVFDGDYPEIKGDQMAWWMLNDDVEHKQSMGIPLGTDVFVSAYLYDCQENTLVANSVFVDYKVINRSEMDYDSTFMGFFTKFFLGCPNDNFTGCLPDANAYYVYNADADDSNCDGMPGFGADVPVRNVAFLDKKLDKYIVYNTGTDAPVAPKTTSPHFPSEYFSYLNGLWKDGSPPTSGGDGADLGGTQPVDYFFPSNPADPQGWSMCTANMSLRNNMSLGSHGPFHFAAGDTFSISVAFSLHQDVPLPCPDFNGLVQPAISQLSAWANAGVLDNTLDLGIVQQLYANNPISLGDPVQGAVYHWSTGETTPTITVSTPGEYAVTVTSEAGCKKVENVLVTLAQSTIQGNEDLGWCISPNPADDFIQIIFPDEGQFAPCRMILRDALGRVLKEESVKWARYKVELRDLPHGFYWLELRRGAQMLGTRKFVHVSR